MHQELARHVVGVCWVPFSRFTGFLRCFRWKRGALPPLGGPNIEPSCGVVFSTCCPHCGVEWSLLSPKQVYNSQPRTVLSIILGLVLGVATYHHLKKCFTKEIMGYWPVTVFPKPVLFLLKVGGGEGRQLGSKRNTKNILYIQYLWIWTVGKPFSQIWSKSWKFLKA